MPSYHIDPWLGNDTNTGASWAAAWKTLNGLRVNAVVPTAGDLLKFAKSEQGSQPSLAFTNTSLVNITLPYSSESATNFALKAYQFGAPSNPMIGTWGWTPVAVPAFSSFNNGRPASAISSSGQFNTPGAKLVRAQQGGSLSIGASQYVYFSYGVQVPFTGVGDTHLPAGTFELWLCSDANGDTPLYVLPLPALNNNGSWSTLVYDHGALFPSVSVTSWSLRRSSTVISRDNSTFGLKIGVVMLARPYSSTTQAWGMHTILAASKGTSVSASPDAVLTDPFALAEQIASRVNFPVYLALAPNFRYTNSLTVKYRTAPCLNLGVVGTSLYSLAAVDSLGAFDLNGSAGGTGLSPLTLQGGYNTATDLVDGYTVFSAEASSDYGPKAALFDLSWADHIVINRISAVNGFASFVTRTRTLTMDACYPGVTLRLPYADSKSFLGLSDTQTHLTIKNVILPPYSIEFLGAIGNLTMENVYADCTDRKAVQEYIECENFLMDRSHIGGWTGAGQTTVPGTLYVSVRENAEMRACTHAYPPPIVNETRLGKTFEVTNSPAYPSWSASNSRWVPTRPLSRWGLIKYRNNNTTGHDWVSTPTTGTPSLNRKLEFDSTNTNQYVLKDPGPDFATTEYQVPALLKAGNYSFSWTPTGSFPPSGVGQYWYNFPIQITVQPNTSSPAHSWGPPWLRANTGVGPSPATSLYTGSLYGYYIRERDPGQFYRSAADYFLRVDGYSGVVRFPALLTAFHPRVHGVGAVRWRPPHRSERSSHDPSTGPCCSHHWGG